MTTPKTKPANPAPFYYRCPVCCVTFTGDAARRHFNFMREARRAETARTPAPIKRIA